MEGRRSPRWLAVLGAGLAVPFAFAGAAAQEAEEPAPIEALVAERGAAIADAAPPVFSGDDLRLIADILVEARLFEALGPDSVLGALQSEE